jgi:hypothetical protein
MPKRVRYSSPCCHVDSQIRGVFLEDGVIILRCPKCCQLERRLLSEGAPEQHERPRLRLVGND